MVGEENTSQDTTYLKLFILESLRNQETCLRTKPRTLKNFIHFDGHYFPKGTVFEINLDILHRHPLLWDRADEFLPQRFSDNEKVEFYKFLPFSAGERICPGKNLTFSILKTFLVTFLQHVKFQRHPSSENNNDLSYMVDISIHKR
jgi:cytochrome P450